LLFNSSAFILFFPTVFLLYWSLGSVRQRNLLLAVASYFFYGCWDWRFLSLLWISTVLDFICGLGIARTESARRRRAFLLASVMGNLGILASFKYFNFFLDSLAPLLDALHLWAARPSLNIILPVGISFYTFQTMSYTIDVYRGRIRPTRNFLSFLVYVAYFPQLVAGPIERAGNLLPQIESDRRLTVERAESGLSLILWGYIKKVAIADAIAPHVDRVFTDPGKFGWAALLAGLYLFAVQIYCDFSGYSDIARGSSRLLGIELMENFKQPYLSANITEFWRRWHISLSTWLRDYLYIPLGGNRKGERRTYLNNMLTMLLGGLWHGAGWTFVVWGGLHGLYLAVHKMLTRGRKIGLSPKPTGPAEALRHALKAFAVFQLVCFAWVFFRSPDFSLAWRYLSSLALLRQGAAGLDVVWYALAYCAAMIILDLAAWVRDAEAPFEWVHRPELRGAVYATMMAWLVLCRGGGGQPFIYFQF